MTIGAAFIAITIAMMFYRLIGFGIQKVHKRLPYIFWWYIV